MVIKHRLFEEDKGNCARWDLCKVWSPQMKNMTESHPPRANKCILPILMLKIQPNNPKDKLQIPEENVETWKTYMKQSLPGDLSQKILYQDMNKRRTIYNLGFRLKEKKDIDLLHTCKEIDVLLFLKSEPKVVDSSSLVHVLVEDLLGEITGQALLHVGLPGLHILLGDLELILGVVGLNFQH